MHKFKIGDREFSWPKFTKRVVDRIRDNFGLDLRGAIREDPKAAAAFLDDEAFLNVFCGLCADQIKAADISREALEEAWDEDAIRAVKESLYEAFFTLSQGLKSARLMVASMRRNATE